MSWKNKEDRICKFQYERLLNAHGFPEGVTPYSSRSEYGTWLRRVHNQEFEARYDVWEKNMIKERGEKE